MSFYLVAGRLTPTNASLLAALQDVGVDARLARPFDLQRPGRADVVLGRLDVLPSLDGVEPGVWQLRRLERDGARILNRANALITTHDKLATALRLARQGIPHPRTWYVDYSSVLPSVRTPVVVKPRFGSWGRDVFRCDDAAALATCLKDVRRRPWFRRQGALVQELVAPRGYDLRIVVAAGRVIGAIERVSAPGEWRTNVALGGSRRAVSPPSDARTVAVAAAAAVRADLVGVDLLPTPSGGWVVLELNGAVDFTRDYSLDGRDAFADAASALALAEPLEASLSAAS